MKKLVAIVLSLAMLLVSVSAMADLVICQNKVEITEQMEAYAKLYTEKTGVEVKIITGGGSSDYNTVLKSEMASGREPDIWVIEGPSGYELWKDKIADQAGADWTQYTAAAYMDGDKVVGFPVAVEGYGLAYNKSILDAAGIDPASITGPESMKAAFETLDSKKDELGLTAVVGWYTEPASLYWTTGQHMFGTYLDEGLARDDTTYFDLLTDGGQLDIDRATAWGEMVALFNQYSDQANMVSGTYDQQILNFASGKYAFVTQGSWIGATMTSDDADAYAEAGNFKVGFAPYAFEDGIDTILTNSPSWWAVFKNDNSAASKAFLQWLTTDEAQEVLVMEAGFISPFKSCKYSATDPFAQTVTDYVSAGKTSSWHWLGDKEGLAQNYLGQVFNDYAQGKMDTAQFVQTVQQVCATAYSG